MSAPLAGVAAGEREELATALDAPGVTVSDVHRLLSRALGREIRGSAHEDRERVLDDIQAKRMWLDTFCRGIGRAGLPAGPQETRVRQEIQRLALEADLIAIALTKLWDLREVKRGRPSDLPSFPQRPVACAVDHGTCSGAGDLRCEL